MRHPATAQSVAAILVAGLVATLAVAAGYEALFALGVIGYADGASAGTAPPHETAILEITFCVMLAAAAGFAVAAAWGRASRAVAALRWLWLVPALCAALVIARYYAFDPYYAPDLIRVSQNVDIRVAALWLIGGTAAVIATRRFAPRAPRMVMAGGAVMLFVAALTTIVLRAGH